MKSTNLALLLLLLGVQAGCSEPIDQSQSPEDAEPVQDSLRIVFDDNGTSTFTAEERILIEDIIRQSENEVRKLLPSLPEKIEVSVVMIDRDTAVVGGVTGRANAPGKVQIEVSSVYPGGTLAAARRSLAGSVFHEFHHLYRGWTIQENRYGPGIPIAAVNEGLADVFTETYTGIYFEEAGRYPENVDEWLAEILLLPPDADYGTWMFEHPDGRTSVGYRVGRYVVHEAMQNSGMDVLALGDLSPEAILKLVPPSSDRIQVASNCAIQQIGNNRWIRAFPRKHYCPSGK
jgi:hypothetical protein